MLLGEGSVAFINIENADHKLLEQLIDEATMEMKELQEARRVGNVPRLGAALCHLELHISVAIKLLEDQFPYFRAVDFRKVIAQKHQKEVF